MSIDDLFAEGELVAMRWQAAGTHTGGLLGLPPSGKHFHFAGMSIFRVADGKVAEQWEAWDKLDLLQQLQLEGASGVVPAPEATR